MTALPLLLALALSSDPAPAPAPAAPQTGSAHAGPAGLEIPWAETYPQALEMARQIPDGRLLVELTARDCGECTRQEAIVIPSTSFFTFMQDKVPVRLPISSPDGQKLARRFGIPNPPAWLVLTTDGLLCGIQAGPTSQEIWFDTFAKTEKSWANYRERLAQEQRTPGDVRLVYAIAEETYKRGGEERAEARFRRLAEATHAAPEIRERSLAYLASIAMDQNRIADAEKDLKALLETGKDPALRERAELRMADVEIAKGRRDLAALRLKQFRKDHPASANVKEADELLRALGQAPEPAAGAK